MLALQEMIKKTLLLRDFSFSTPLPNIDAAPKAYSATNFLLKTLTRKIELSRLGLL